MPKVPPLSSRTVDPMHLRLRLNGQEVEAEVAPATRLSTFLRETMRLTGLKEGCCEGECGACTVLLDGLPINACLMLAFQAGGRTVVTVEGLSDNGPGGLQRRFVEMGAVQCGYCTPGMIIAAEGLLRSDTAPDEPAIRHALAGNLCRCTGFETIVDAVASEAAGRRLRSAAS